MTKSNTAWDCHYKQDAKSLLFITPNEKCIISVHSYPSIDNNRAQGYGIWYDILGEHELNIALVTRTEPIWKPALYRIHDDFLQWYEPRGENGFNVFHTRRELTNVDNEFMDEYYKTLERITKRRSNPFK